MKWFFLALALVAPSQAGLRFGCSTISIQRLDPLVEPGNIPSAHVHQIVGGNVFNATMDSTKMDIGNTGTCTTCFFSEDFSNYWTAVLYFKARNGTYKRVPIYTNADLEGEVGGMTIYYTQLDFNSNGNQKITAFKPGFRMTVGSPTTNTKAAAVAHTGIRYTCLQTVMTRGQETPDFPKAACPAGIMAIHHFPACWDGKNLDSANHQDHMFDTGKGGFQNAGPCPSSHPIRMPQLAYETLWDTRAFNNKADWPADGSQPFVWSANADPTGYASHGDYIFGWKGDALQKAMDSTCMFQACGNGKPLKSQSAAELNKCAIKNTVTEETQGWLPALPGVAVGHM